jgi:hypothetical protein
VQAYPKYCFYRCWAWLHPYFPISGKQGKFLCNLPILLFIGLQYFSNIANSQTLDSAYFVTCKQSPSNSFCFNSVQYFNTRSCLPAQTTTQRAVINIPIDTIREWEINTEVFIGINPSSTNYLELQLDFQADTLKTSNTLRLGDKTDNISVYTNNQIINQTPSIFNRNNSQLKLRLLFQSSILSIFWHWKDSTEWLPLSTISVNPKARLTNISINLTQTGSSSVGKWNFQLFKPRPIIKDTIPPVIQDFVLKTTSKAWLIFNEPINIDSARCQIVDSLNLCILKKLNYTTVEITTPRPWPCNDSFRITIQGLRDSVYNYSKNEVINAFYPCLKNINRGELIVTEIMHNPVKTNQQINTLPPIKYIELTNTSNHGLWLTNTQICDAVSCAKLPKYWLKPKQLIVLFDNKDSNKISNDFKKISLPVPNFPSFNTTEDSIIIKNNNNEIIYQNRYRQEYHQEPFHLGGYSLERAYNKPNELHWLNWQSNIGIGGSPGFVDSCIRISPIPSQLFSVALLKQSNQIEIHCNQPLSPQQWESIEISCIDSQKKSLILTTYVTNINANKATINFPTSNFSQLINNTQLFLKAPLYYMLESVKDTIDLIHESTIKTPTTADLIFSEIQFNATDNAFDFLEIYNKSNSALDLKSIVIRYYNEDSIPRWQIPINSTNAILPPKQCLVICKDAEIMRQHYPDLSMVKIMENPIFNGLNADYGLIEIMDISSFTRLHLAGYNSSWHHPELDETQNISLERVGTNASATNPWNWRSHGNRNIQNLLQNPCNTNSGSANNHQSACNSPGFHQEWLIKDNSATFKLNQWKLFQASSNNYLCLEYQLPMPDCLIQVKMLTVSGQLVAVPVQKERIDFNGNLCFPASTTAKLSKGAYLIAVRCLMPDGNIIQKHLPFSIL